MTDEDIARLHEFHRAYHDACIEDDPAAALAADMAFHEYVVRRSGNRHLADFIHKLSILRLPLEMHSHAATPIRWAGDRDCHLPLVNALATRDPRAAARAILQHIREGVYDHAANRAAEDSPDGHAIGVPAEG